VSFDQKLASLQIDFFVIPSVVNKNNFTIAMKRTIVACGKLVDLVYTEANNNRKLQEIT
jgi:hypothetical protein